MGTHQLDNLFVSWSVLFYLDYLEIIQPTGVYLSVQRLSTDNRQEIVVVWLSVQKFLQWYILHKIYQGYVFLSARLELGVTPPQKNAFKCQLIVVLNGLIIQLTFALLHVQQQPTLLEISQPNCVLLYAPIQQLYTSLMLRLDYAL